MYEGSVLLIMIVLLVLIGIVSYYIYDYYGYKAKVSKDITTTNQKVDTEKNQRIGNVKSIVDQVNMVNDGIENELTKMNLDMKTNTDDLTVLDRGINTIMSFKEKRGNNSYSQIGLSDLPSANEPDVNLLTHVTSVGGLTIKELDKSQSPQKSMRICGTEDPSKCIKIPDENGDVYFTNLYQDKAISFDGSTVINAPLSFKESNQLGARISGSQDGTSSMETNALGIRPIGSTSTTPTASIHIQSSGTNPLTPFKVTVNNSDLLDIDKDGTLHAKRIELREPGSTSSKATFSIVSDGIKVEAPNVYVNGNLHVTGQITPNYSTGAPATGAPATGAPATGGTVTGGTVAGFRSGPIVMGVDGFCGSAYTNKPADYMNAQYLLSVQ